MLAPSRILALGVLLATGCSDTGAGSGARPVPFDAATALDAAPREPTFAPTFAAVYSEVIAAHNCLLGLCHGEGASGGGLSLFPKATARQKLLARSTGFECRALGLAGVDPGNPESSLLWLKLQADPPCGVRMPPNRDVDPRHVEQVRSWIAAGAPED